MAAASSVLYSIILGMMYFLVELETGRKAFKFTLFNNEVDVCYSNLIG